MNYSVNVTIPNLEFETTLTSTEVPVPVYITYQIGWICPRCGTVYNPSVLVCDKCTPFTVPLSMPTVHWKSTYETC